MPRTNTEDRRKLVPHHVYNRAKPDRRVFMDNADRNEFLSLIGSRLSRANGQRPRAQRKVRPIDGVELLGFCLMTSHFHLVVWQRQDEALRRFMQSVLTSYVRYFNRRHGMSGSMFKGAYRARPLEDAKDLCWTVAYVHANHPAGLDYRYSTHRAYVNEDLRPGWLNTRAALAHFGGVDRYRDYLAQRDLRANLNALFF